MNQRRALRAVKAEADYGLGLEDLFADTLTFSMTVRGKALEVTWAPARYTPDVEAAAMALTKPFEDEEEETEPDSPEAQTRLGNRLRANQQATRDVLSHVLVRWTLHDASGADVGTDEATLRTLPPAFLDLVFGALWENAGPKAETAPTSGPSS